MNREWIKKAVVLAAVATLSAFCGKSTNSDRPSASIEPTSVSSPLPLAGPNAGPAISADDPDTVVRKAAEAGQGGSVVVIKVWDGYVDETRVQQVRVQQTPVQQTPVQKTPVQQTPVQQSPVQQTPVQQYPVQQYPVQQYPVQ